jgi:hypothetical protein
VMLPVSLVVVVMAELLVSATSAGLPVP